MKISIKDYENYLNNIKNFKQEEFLYYLNNIKYEYIFYELKNRIKKIDLDHQILNSILTKQEINIDKMDIKNATNIMDSDTFINIEQNIKDYKIMINNFNKYFISKEIIKHSPIDMYIHATEEEIKLGLTVVPSYIIIMYIKESLEHYSNIYEALYAYTSINCSGSDILGIQLNINEYEKKVLPDATKKYFYDFLSSLNEYLKNDISIDKIIAGEK